jgi:hypothetical protein
MLTSPKTPYWRFFRNATSGGEVGYGSFAHFEREAGMTASPHERTYPAVIRSSESCQFRTKADCTDVQCPSENE